MNMVELIVVDDEEEVFRALDTVADSGPPSHDRRVGDGIRIRMVRPRISIPYHYV